VLKRKGTRQRQEIKELRSKLQKFLLRRIDKSQKQKGFSIWQRFVSQWNDYAFRDAMQVAQTRLEEFRKGMDLSER
jgi:hypothetical protein